MVTILIVDDHEQNRYLLQMMLASSGYQVLEASNGVEALELARGLQPDLIVSDILMPQMDGFALCRECKRDEALRHIPFVFYTATYTDPRDEALGLQLGAARFIVKPVETEDFFAIIRQVMQDQADHQLTAARPPLEEETVFYKLYNEALVRKLEDKMLDLEQLNQKLAKSEARFRNLAENAQDLIFRYEFIPKTGFTYVSPSASAITGYTPEEFYADADLVVKLVHPGDRSLLEAAGRGEIPAVQPLVLRWQRKDGQIIWTEQRNVPFYNSEGELVAIEGIVRDVTLSRQHQRELEAIAAVSTSLRVALTRTELLPILLDQLLSLLEVDGTALAVTEPPQGDLRVALGRGVWTKLTGVILPKNKGIFAQVLETGNPSLDNDIGSNPQLFPPEVFGSCRAALVAPLHDQKQQFGLLWVGCERTLTAEDFSLFNAIAEITSNALRRITSYEDTVRRVEQLRSLQTIDRVINASLDLQFSMKIIIEQTMARLNADAAGLLLYDPPTLSLKYAAGYGFRGIKYHLSQLRVDEGQTGQAAMERQIVYIPNINICQPPFNRLQLLADENFVSYVAAPLITRGQIKGVLETFHRKFFQPNDEWLDYFESLALQAAIAINNIQLIEGLQRSNAEISMFYDLFLQRWARFLDIRNQKDPDHSLRLAETTLRLAQDAGLSAEELIHVRRGALLHDIGMIRVPEAVMNKPGELSEEEWSIIRTHPQISYNSLKDIPYLMPALEIPYCHHEKWDGSGYPRGLKGDQIPLKARIFSVVYVWEALLSDRPYRKAWSKVEALAYIREQAGIQFDPKAVGLFAKIISE